MFKMFSKNGLTSSIVDAANHLASTYVISSKSKLLKTVQNYILTLPIVGCLKLIYLKLRRVKKACIFDTTDLTKRLWKASFCLTSDERGGEITNDKAIDMCQVDMDTWGQRTHADHSSCDRGLNTGCGLGDKRVWPSPLLSSPLSSFLASYHFLFILMNSTNALCN